MDWKDKLATLKDSPDIPKAQDDPVSEAQGSDCMNLSDKLDVVVERKGRKGKTATIIGGFTCSDRQLQDIARILKQKIGTGGSARYNEILIQGEWRERTVEILKNLGYKI